jgi:flagellar biosynthesis protein FliR
MKNKKETPRLITALIASILILASIPALESRQTSLAFFLIFLGSMGFGAIFQSIRQERAKE